MFKYRFKLGVGSTRLIASLLALSLLACACTDDANNLTDAEPPSDAGSALDPLSQIVGTWTSNFGTTETITTNEWVGYAIVEYDGSARQVIIQSPPDDEYTPNQFHRVVWTPLVANSFHYCWEVFGKETGPDALSDETRANADALDTTGCGGFRWTQLTRP